MDVERLEAILTTCEQALAGSGRVDLRRLGFWKAVEAVKRRPDWIERYADRIAEIDRRAFERAVRPTIPPDAGTAALGLGTAAGLLLVAATYYVPVQWKGIALLAGTGALLMTTHGLAHYVVGRALGMRFTHWYVDGPTRLQPGLKVDYASYLRTPARARAWMHAAGALVTKAVPFALLGAALAAGVPAWATAVLVGIGVVQIVTDVVFSVRHSDWKRFRREMRVARQISRG
ncbi:MAG: hypothetical protein HY331_15015 [Chloroflexi bacterium]|nr:hypothetical protein [Chloroflexota bacterium]